MNRCIDNNNPLKTTSDSIEGSEHYYIALSIDDYQNISLAFCFAVS